MSCSKLSTEDQQQLAKWMGCYRIQLKLLYKASRDGCTGQAFHQKCDGKGETLSIGYLDGGHVYGGYSSIDIDGSNVWKRDAKAFLFRLRKEGKTAYLHFPPTDKAHVLGDPNRGPTFGSPTRIELSFFSGNIDKAANDLFTLNTEVVIDGAGTKAFDAGGHGPVDLAGATTVFRDIEVYQVIAAKLLDENEPWRKVTLGWGEREVQDLRNGMSTYKPSQLLKIRQVNLLLVGQVGAGKSSFCNTVNSLFRGHVTSKVNAGSSEHSLTTTFRRYEFRTTLEGRGMGFQIWDTMGLEEDQDYRTICLPELLDGRIKDGYQFNPWAAISQENAYYNEHATLNDKAHVLVMVIDGTSVDVMSRVMIDKMKETRKMAYQRVVPIILLVTKVDKVDPLVSDDTRNIYRSALVRDTIDTLSDKLGVPKHNIMPVKSYESEIELDPAVDMLALTALRQMLRLADDFCENHMEKNRMYAPGGEREMDEKDEDQDDNKSINTHRKDADGKGKSGRKNIL